MCLPYAVAQHNCNGWFREAYTTTVTGDDTKIVFEQYGPIPLSFMVASDRGETETFLRSQLDMVHQLLLLEFGPSVLYNRRKIHNAFFQQPEQQIRITRIIETLCYLSDHKQSFLVQAIESLLPNTNKHMNTDILNTLKQGSALPNISHTILLVGTKQLMQWSKPRAFAFDPQDIYLLSIWYWSYFYSVSDMRKEESDCQSDDDDEGFQGIDIDMDDISNILRHGIVVGYAHPMVEILQCMLAHMGVYTQKIEPSFTNATFQALRDVLKDERTASVIILETVSRLVQCAEQAVVAGIPGEPKNLKYSMQQCLDICKHVVCQAEGLPKREPKKSRRSQMGDTQNLNPIYKEIHLQTGARHLPYWYVQLLMHFTDYLGFIFQKLLRILPVLWLLWYSSSFQRICKVFQRGSIHCFYLCRK